MIWARISDGLVAELITTDADVNTLYTPEIVATLVKADNTVREGWAWDGQAFAAPITPLPTIDDELDARIAAGLKTTSQ